MLGGIAAIVCGGLVIAGARYEERSQENFFQQYPQLRPGTFQKIHDVEICVKILPTQLQLKCLKYLGGLFIAGGCYRIYQKISNRNKTKISI